MLKFFLSIFILVFFITGCAKRPESIAASYVSPERYSNYTCKSLVSELSEARFQLDEASSKQNSEANFDMFTVWLIVVPQSNVFGDKEGSVARAKGKVEAIETALVMKKCLPSE